MPRYLPTIPQIKHNRIAQFRKLGDHCKILSKKRFIDDEHFVAAQGVVNDQVIKLLLGDQLAGRFKVAAAAGQQPLFEAQAGGGVVPG